MITVYTQPRCMPCDQTKRFLDKHGVDYTVIDVAQQPEERDRLIADGWLTMPVVDPGNGGKPWSGFRLPELRALAATHRNVP